jgi:hypothetical protein
MDVAVPNDLADVLAEALRQFSRGVADRRSAFRTPTIATVAPDGAPSARTMVLRGFDPAARRLVLHTDRRAGKLVDLGHAPRVAVHVYDPRAAVQVRLSALAQVHVGDAAAHAAWAASAPASRAGYATEPAPGTELPAPPPAPADTDAGFGNFAVLALTFDVLEWLWLHRDGHRRARFAWPADGSPHAAWLVP